MRRSTLLAILVILMCIVTAIVIQAQSPIMVASGSHTTKSFTNKQGFVLPASVSDTTMVYQSARGAQYYFKVSKKTGKIYKVYLKKKGA